MLAIGLAGLLLYELALNDVLPEIYVWQDVMSAVSYCQILRNDNQQLVFGYNIINNIVAIRSLSAITLLVAPTCMMTLLIVLSGGADLGGLQEALGEPEGSSTTHRCRA